jgi:hypothetical protein
MLKYSAAVVIATLHLNRALVCGLLQLAFRRLIFWLLQVVAVAHQDIQAVVEPGLELVLLLLRVLLTQVAVGVAVGLRRQPVEQAALALSSLKYLTT